MTAEQGRQLPPIDRVLKGREREAAHRELETLVHNAIMAIPSAVRAGAEAQWNGDTNFLFEHNERVYEVQRRTINVRGGFGRERRVIRYHKVTPGEVSVWGSRDKRGDYDGEVYFATHHLSALDKAQGIVASANPAFGYKDDKFQVPYFEGSRSGDPVVNTEDATQRIRKFVEELKVGTS